MVSRLLILIYALVAYALATATLLYLIGFLLDVGVPKSVNDGAPGTLWGAILRDLGLVWLFGLHHSATARRWFKRRWTRIIPPAMERSTYLLMTTAATALLVWLWVPIPATVWRVESAVGSWVLIGLALAVWAMMVAATFHFGHFAFFGLRQAWDRYLQRPSGEGGFCARWLYGLVRHPISLGWMLAPWLTPHMTVGQAVFAFGVVVYVVVATPFEEADLIAALGEKYRRYRREVPAFIPRAPRLSGGADASSAPGAAPGRTR